MSDAGSAFVRGFGEQAQESGGVVWSLAGGGAVILESGKARVTQVEEVDPDSGERWSFHTPLDGDPLDGAAVFRHIAVDAGESGTIVCTAVGAEGISGHAEERTVGAIRKDAEEVSYDEALISTQYDGSGDPTRFGLELWPPDADHTTRAAATRVSASLLGGARSGGAWGGLFRCHTDGVEGIGTYLLWRP